MSISAFRIENVSLNDEVILRWWANEFRQYWPDNIYPELLKTEYRRVVYLPECDDPAAVASVTWTNSIDGIDDGAAWLDHVLVARWAQGRHLTRILYVDRMIYAARFSSRRIFTIAINVQVERFFERRNWKRYRKAKTHGKTYPVLTLPK